MTSQTIDTHSLHFDLGPTSANNWSEVMLEHHGMHCQLDASLSAASTAHSWSLGDVGLTLADLSSVILMPVGEERASWQGEWLYLKLMTGGQVDIEACGHRQRFTTGHMFFIDPERAFTEAFTARGQMTVLRIPKAVLRDRGLRSSLPAPQVANMNSADMRATRALIHCIAQQRFEPGPVIRELMGRQLLDLIDAMLGHPGDRAISRSTEVVVLRAKRYIHGALSDTSLDSTAIAAAAHVSVKHLQRLFRDQGTSVMRHVWSVRLHHARSLLSPTRVPRATVQEVAWRCGFSTAAHFSRAYHAQFGVRPSHLESYTR
ncbi:AraC family transcriptional regulator [Pseudomonas sp. 15A4]|nr:AraC family transcriptional regulator [Pseudomonas sp. 15A4]